MSRRDASLMTMLLALVPANTVVAGKDATGKAAGTCGDPQSLELGEKWGMEMSLKDRIAQFDAKRNRPPEVLAIIRRGIDSIRGSGAAGLRIGERAPDFVLPNQRGEAVNLGDRLSRGPVVLSFYRGVW